MHLKKKCVVLIVMGLCGGLTLGCSTKANDVEPIQQGIEKKSEEGELPLVASESMTKSELEIVIDSPIKGRWEIFNPPGHPDLAYDFVAVNENDNPYAPKFLLPHLFFYISVESTFAWEQPIYAPFKGEVVESYDGEKDRTKISLLKDIISSYINRPKSDSPFNKLGGNYIVVKSHEGDFYALLAHLKSGSNRVSTGDTVSEGQLVGEVGNSGTSIQPHLHFQLMKTPEPFPYSENLLKFKFKKFHAKKDGKWVVRLLHNVSNGDLIDF